MSEAVLSTIWAELGGPPDALDRVSFTGPVHTFPGPFPVDDLAAPFPGHALRSQRSCGR